MIQRYVGVRVRMRRMDCRLSVEADIGCLLSRGCMHRIRELVIIVEEGMHLLLVGVWHRRKENMSVVVNVGAIAE